MKNGKEASIPISSSCYLGVVEKGKSVDQTKYKGLIGSLLYLIGSRHGNMFVASLCARF